MAALEREALFQLDGVGDAALGEWRDDRPAAFHIRRRLSAEEVERYGVGAVCDLRGTEEGRARLRAALVWLRPEFVAWAREEVEQCAETQRGGR